MERTTDAGVGVVFDQYPAKARNKLEEIRQLIFQAAEDEGIQHLEECLRWNEPAYIAKGGSTVRLGWSAKQADNVAVYFHCQTRLLDTFRELYSETFTYEGNRAIVFSSDQVVSEAELKHCLALALTYHQRKHLPLLGA